MKSLKKIVCLLTTILMLSALCVQPASAAQGTMLGLPPDARMDIFEHGTAPQSLGDYTVKQYAGTYYFIEKCGGYYYAFSPTGSSYQSAFVNVKLPTGLNRAGVRNAYISLGIQGTKHGIDLGICNQGSGWMPYSNDVGEGTPANPSFKTYPECTALVGATSAIMTAKPISTTQVYLYVQFQDASGNNVGPAFERNISVASGNLTMSGSKVSCRFFRFASLVQPNSVYDDQGDGSYMTGGMFRNCQLYNGSKYVSWGIGSGTVKDCFAVSPSHITLSYSGQNDTFNIRHNG